jgi:CheY-like chemotaxis protein
MALAQQHDTRDSAPKRRLLVVDDNRDAAESMSMLLQMWGHDVVFAYDGPTALETAEQWHPEAVFLDIGLPGMDGYEVAARLRELPHAKGTVLIAITGYGQDDDRLRSQRAGIDHHLVKPVAPDALRSLIDSLQVH